MQVWCEGAHHVMAADDSVVAAVAAGDVTGFVATARDLAVAASSWDTPSWREAPRAPTTAPFIEREVLAAQGLADLLADRYWESDRNDGYVTVPVPPRVWDDPDAALHAAVDLRDALGRQNVLIGIPGVPEALGTVTACAAHGVPLNVDLLVSAGQVVRFAAAFLSGAARVRRAEMACVLTLRLGLLEQELAGRLARLGERTVLAHLAGEVQASLAADAISRFRVADHLRLRLVLAGPAGVCPIVGPPEADEVAKGSRVLAMLRETGVDLSGAADAATEDAAAVYTDLVWMADELALAGEWHDPSGLL